MNGLATTVEKLVVTIEELKGELSKRADEDLRLVLEAVSKISNPQTSDPAASISTKAVKEGPLSYLRNPDVTPELDAIIKLVVSGARERGKQDKDKKNLLQNSLKVSDDPMG